MFSFNLKYFRAMILVFITEICIALFVHDDIIRPFIGDVLASILVYLMLKSFISLTVLKACVFSLLFSYFLEFLQAINFLEVSGLKSSKLIAIVLGSSFDWRDILAYTVGILIVFIKEKNILKSQKIRNLINFHYLRSASPLEDSLSPGEGRGEVKIEKNIKFNLAAASERLNSLPDVKDLKSIT